MREEKRTGKGNRAFSKNVREEERTGTKNRAVSKMGEKRREEDGYK